MNLKKKKKKKRKNVLKNDNKHVFLKNCEIDKYLQR